MVPLGQRLLERQNLVAARVSRNIFEQSWIGGIVTHGNPDNESRIAGVQSRFRWILQPGNDLFLVLDREWYRTLDDNRFEPSFDRGSAKLQYTFRF